MAKKAAKKPKKPKVKAIVCKGKKGCGYTFMPTDVPTNKQWNMVSPMPDKDGNVTITIMATWTCPQCGKSITGAFAKTKGEMDGESKKDKLINALKSGNPVNLADFAKTIGYKPENVEKMANLFIKKGLVKGKVENGIFTLE